MAGDDVVFTVPIEAAPAAVIEAVSTAGGVTGWWTDKAEIKGDKAVLTFPGAEAPYDFAIRENGPERVVWVTGDHPPNWQGTTISYEVGPGEGGGSALFFRHEGFTNDQERGFIAFFWAQIMGRLKGYTESGEANPFFTGG